MTLDYKIISKAASDITLALVKEHLKIDASDTSEDAYLTLLLNASIELAEKYTKLVLTTTVFEIDFIDDTLCDIELRRSPYVSLNTITVDGESYDLSNVEVDDTKYPYAYVDFGILIVETANINFTAGYSTTPYGIVLAILNLVALLYENRGDCPESKIPSNIACMLDKFRLIEV